MSVMALFGTNNKEKAVAFYDAVFGEMGAGRIFASDLAQFWGDKNGPILGVGTPRNGQPATFGNGSQVAIRVPERANVDAMYNKAIELGGTDEGKPGERSPTFYAAYFRDLDGNKICLIKQG